MSLLEGFLPKKHDLKVNVTSIRVVFSNKHIHISLSEKHVSNELFALANFVFAAKLRAGLFLAMLHRYNPKAYVERVRGLGIFGLCLSCCGLVPNGDELKWAKDGAPFSCAKWRANEKLLEGLVRTGQVFLGPRRTSWISHCFCLLRGRIFLCSTFGKSFSFMT